MQPAKELKKLCKYWQKKLGLQTWDLRISWLPDKEAVSGNYACVMVDVHHRVAMVRITPLRRLVSPDVSGQSIKQNLLVYNLERSVLHELLHVYLHEYNIGRIGEGALDDQLEERFINNLADALIGERWSKSPKES